MKHFNEIKKWFTNQKHLYFLFVIVLMVPNAFLFYTETMSVFTRIAFVLMPLGAYMEIMAAFRKPGIMFWILLPLLVLGAFQLVLLNLFGESIIATDMFLNLFTTNSGEAMELLGKLVPAIVGVCLLYLPALALGVCSIRISAVLGERFRRRMLMYAAALFLSGTIFAVLARWQDSSFRICLHIYPANVFYNMKLAACSFEKSLTYLQLRGISTSMRIPPLIPGSGKYTS